MSDDFRISEPDILIAASVFLITRGVTPYQFSVASGRGLDSTRATERLREACRTMGFTPRFTGDGADILGISDTEWWIIECKGAGSGKSQTQRNNFDRALASMVSYYEEKPQGVGPEYQNTTVCLGLALPATRLYLNELRRRVRAPLRKRLNLWILLYEPNSKLIRAVSPEESLCEH